jgi:hypothetical protein
MRGVFTTPYAVNLARLDRKQRKDILANHLFAYQDEPVSVRELSDYVRRCLYLDLSNVPWVLDDAELVGDVGKCSACPKRTGSSPTLCTDMEHNTCTDRACFEKKMSAHIQKQIDSRPGMLRFSDYPTNHKKDATILTGATCRRLWGKEDRCVAPQRKRLSSTETSKGKPCWCAGTRNARSTDCNPDGLAAGTTLMPPTEETPVGENLPGAPVFGALVRLRRDMNCSLSIAPSE